MLIAPFLGWSMGKSETRIAVWLGVLATVLGCALAYLAVPEGRLPSLVGLEWVVIRLLYLGGPLVVVFGLVSPARTACEVARKACEAAVTQCEAQGRNIISGDQQFHAWLENEQKKLRTDLDTRIAELRTDLGTRMTSALADFGKRFDVAEEHFKQRVDDATRTIELAKR